MADSSTGKAPKPRSEMVTRDDTAPVWMWQGSLWIMGLTGLGIGAILLLALYGIADVVPSGAPIIEQDLDDLTEWTLWTSSDVVDWNREARQLAVNEVETRAILLSPYSLPASATLLIRVIQTQGPLDAGYGLWWGNMSNGDYVVVALNSNGYVTVQQFDSGNSTGIRDWQYFPHVRPQLRINQIQVKLIGDIAVVWINDEIVAEFEWINAQPSHAGVYAETFAAGGLTVQIERFAIWDNAQP